jgi:hypothetical protein
MSPAEAALELVLTELLTTGTSSALFRVTSSSRDPQIPWST